MAAVVKESFTGGELTKKEAIAYSGVVQVLGLASLLNYITVRRPTRRLSVFFVALWVDVRENLRVRSFLTGEYANPVRSPAQSRLASALGGFYNLRGATS